VDDPIGAFFMQIQGAGRVRLDDGTVIRLEYDGQNGRDYVPVGRLLVERGEILRDKLSMAAIRDWMTRHPVAGAALRREDPSYVFFRKLSGAGPIGAEPVALTPRRSIAIDPSFVPLVCRSGWMRQKRMCRVGDCVGCSSHKIRGAR
jgi:peptidoglycan lytic transglycosylase A